jgi:hypothetical protein
MMETAVSDRACSPPGAPAIGLDEVNRG